MGHEFRIRVATPWPPASLAQCHQFLARLADALPLTVAIVEAHAHGYQTRTYEYRDAGSLAAMPSAHVQLEARGFYLCENGGGTGLLDQLVRYALAAAGEVAVEEL